MHWGELYQHCITSALSLRPWDNWRWYSRKPWKSPCLGRGRPGRRGWAQEGGGLGVRAGNPSWRGMECFKRTCSELPGRGRLPLRCWSLSFAGALALERGAEKGSSGSPLLSYSLSHWRTSPLTGYKQGGSVDQSGWGHRGVRRGSRILSL